MDQLDENDFEKEIDETSELKMTIQERIINIELAIKPDSSVSEDDDVIDSARSSSRTSSSKKTKRLIQTSQNEIGYLGCQRVVELKAREKRRFVGGSGNVVEKPWLKPKIPRDPITAAALFLPERGQTNCYFCNHRGHRSFNCTSVTDPEKRKEILKKKGRCFVCLRRGHVSNCCPSEYKCKKCFGRHHISVCSGGFHSPQDVTQNATQGNAIEPPNVTQPCPGATATLHVGGKNSVLLQTATANVSNPRSGKTVQARLVFDSGSQRSYIANGLRSSLERPSLRYENLVIKTFGAGSDQPKRCDVVQLCVSKAVGGLNLYVDAYDVPSICAPLSQQKIELAQASYEHLSSLELADSSTGEDGMPIDILIGSDFYWQFMTGEIRFVMYGGPVAINTLLGWVLSGPVYESWQMLVESSTQLSHTHVLRLDTEQKEENCPLKQELSRFWDIESLGIFPESEGTVYERFLNRVQMKDARYEVSLPWKEMHPALPDNYSLSYSRLASLIGRLRKSPEVLREYDRVIKDQQSRGIVETVSPNDATHVHYLPHREVVRSDKQTTKLRIVFDASAKRDGPSLNDCLHAGSPQTQLLMDIMMRFRCHQIALVGDIEKAFLMVGVNAAYRDVLGFLWVKDPFVSKPKVEIKRFTRLMFGVSSSLFLLNATLRHHMSKYALCDPEFVKKSLEALYVDDLSTGDRNELIEKIKASEYGRGVEPINRLSELEEDEETYASATLGSNHEINEEQEHKVLGVTWNHDTDELRIDLSDTVKFSENLSVTKRTVLKVTARVYDPLGWISPILIEMKLLFQKLYQSKEDWDEELSPDMRERYDKWMSELRKVGGIRIPRC
ncbi:uncharacterized protein [Acropora muricata]|uniref:uncharacterized protein n=1 Tax=Acropora muricata TaxID=159855 RepID=UPI0034E43F2C